MGSALQEREYDMSADEQIRENTRNIAALTSTVTELSATFKASEDVRREERADVKAAVSELKELNVKMAGMAGVQKDLTTAMGDVRALYEKVNGVIPLKEKMGEAEKKLENHEGRINTIESWVDKIEGGKVFARCLWAFVSMGGLGLVAWAVSAFQHSKIGAIIGGE